MRRVPLLLAVAVLVSTAGSLAAEPPSPPTPLRLEYAREPGAEACPDETEFKDSLATKVRWPLFKDPAARDRLVLRLQGRGGWYTGVAEVHDAADGITWKFPLGPVRDCSAIVDTMALAVAIQIDPLASQPPPAPPPQPPPALPAPQPILIVPPPPTRDVAVPSPPAAEPRFRVGLGAGLALGSGPGWAPSFSIDLGARWRDRPLSLAFEGAVVPPSSGTINGVRVSTYRVTGAGLACGHFARFLFACGMAQVGAFHGTGAAMNLSSESTTVFFAALGGATGAEFPVHEHVGLRITGNALVTVARPTLQIDSMNFYSASTLSGAIGAGPIFIF